MAAISLGNCGNVPSLHGGTGPGRVAGSERRRREVGARPRRIVPATGFGDLAHGLWRVVALYKTTAFPEDLCLSQAHRVGRGGREAVFHEAASRRKNLFRLTFWPLRTWRIEARRCYNAREKAKFLKIIWLKFTKKRHHNAWKKWVQKRVRDRAKADRHYREYYLTEQEGLKCFSTWLLFARQRRLTEKEVVPTPEGWRSFEEAMHPRPEIAGANRLEVLPVF